MLKEFTVYLERMYIEWSLIFCDFILEIQLFMLGKKLGVGKEKQFK